MPRAKRKRFSNPRRRRSDPEQAAEEKEAAANAGQAPPSPPTSSTTSHDDHDDDALPPFYNTTFSTHRVSPLYIGPQPLSRARLEVLARRLRDTLVGDIVRGIEVGLDGGNDTSMTRAGALELVEVRWVRLDSLLGLATEHGDEEDDGDDSIVNRTHRPSSRDLSIDAPPDFGRRVWRRQRALCISLQYENALCTAVLMPTLSRPDEESTDKDDNAPQPNNSLFNMPPSAVDNAGVSGNSSQHFVHLPLLLLRMPPPLKPIIVDFLSTTFDCRIQPLRLGTRSLAQTWERWVRDAGVPVRGPSAKDALLTLGFYAPSVVSDKASPPQKKQTDEDSSEDEAAVVLGLRSIDVIIPAEDIRRFVEAGKSSRPQSAKHKDEDPRKRRKIGGQTDEEGWWWRYLALADSSEEADNEHTPQQPFLEALARYIDHHLALDIFHPAVRIQRIACGSFVLSEGRVKIFAPAGHAEGELALSGAERQGVQGFVAGLIDRAKGKPLGKG